MKTTAEIIEILRDYKARSAEKYGIETLGLFGSVVNRMRRVTSMFLLS